MLSQHFYTYMAELLCSGSPAGDPLYFAIGNGLAGWDTAPPILSRDSLSYQHEIARKQVLPEDITYVDEFSQPTDLITPRIAVNVTFAPGEGVGTVRECGLFALGASEQPGSGLLVSYFVHPRIDKAVDTQLHRRIILNLLPEPYRVHGHETRYLGNALTEELHDVQQATGACQLAEIRPDRRYYFDSPAQAIALGYDYCAFCFGRELSQR
ncbi:MAG: hypothetical protein GC149_14130 [Gammaproteobacteria bacterium]|nr:hypothetical protein [Gammaproteobacteria bacterium]